MDLINNFLVLASYQFNPPSSSGGKILNYQFCKFLNLATNCYVFTTDNNNSTKDFNLLPFLKNNFSRYIPFNYSKVLSRIIKEKQINAVIAIQPYLGASAILTTKFNKIPFILYSHNIESQRFRSIGKWWWPILFIYEMFIMKLADQNFFVSNQDKTWAINNYKLNPNRCNYLPFGTPLKSEPELQTEKKEEIAKKYHLDESKDWIYFIGSMNYAPNYLTVANLNRKIVNKLKESNQNIQILIIGGGLSKELQSDLLNNSPFIKYLGFVENIDEIIAHCNAMLNPTLIGGGIKTKAIEALSYSKQLIGFENAAFGIESKYTGEMMSTVSDGDWETLYNNIKDKVHLKKRTPQEFYNQYYWGNLINIFLDKIK
jgi:glycosyltransferase involved in cell wall biosynthesis